MASSTSTTAQELLGIQAFLVETAHAAGEIIVKASPVRGTGPTATGQIKVDFKLNSVDLVTETDRGVENFVREKLASKYPDYAFFGEESYEKGKQVPAGPAFIVDPIDGTTNFVHGNPYLCISIGFAVDRSPVVGVIYNPLTGQLYRAAKGCGAYLTAPEVVVDTPASSDEDQSDNSALPPARTFRAVTRQLPLARPAAPLPEVGAALILTEWGNVRDGNDFAVKADTFAQLAASKPGAHVHSLRALGSAALNLCGVASGIFDAYWEAGGYSWDICAGWCILSEAGGALVDTNPGGWTTTLSQRRYFAIRAGSQKPEDYPNSDGEVPAGITAETRQFVTEFWSHVRGVYEVGPDS